MTGAVFGLSTFSFQSWADAYNPRVRGGRRAAARQPIPLRSIGCLAAGLGLAESFYRQSFTLPLTSGPKWKYSWEILSPPKGSSPISICRLPDSLHFGSLSNRSTLRLLLYQKYHLQDLAQLQAPRAGQPNINGTEYAALQIPLPPLKEQKRIVELLDQADALRQQRREADKLSQRIIPAIFHEMFGDPLDRKNQIEKRPLSELGSLDRGVSKHRPRNAQELLGGNYPLVQTGDISNSNGLITSYTSTYSEIGLAQSKLWQAGTLCVTIAANIGKTAILTFDACFPDSVVGFVPNEKSRVEYVQALFGFLQPLLEANAPAAAQKNINLKTLRELNVLAPSPELQEEFGKRIKTVRAIRDGSETASTKLETLFQTLLHRAFDGSLTASWREAHAAELLQEMERQS